MNDLVKKMRQCATRIGNSKFPDYHGQKWLDRGAHEIERLSAENSDLKKIVASYILPSEAMYFDREKVERYIQDYLDSASTRQEQECPDCDGRGFTRFNAYGRGESQATADFPCETCDESGYVTAEPQQENNSE